MQITQSTKLFSLAQQRLPGGVNSPVRAFKSVNMTPLFITRGKDQNSLTRMVTNILTTWVRGDQ